MKIKTRVFTTNNKLALDWLTPYFNASFSESLDTVKEIVSDLSTAVILPTLINGGVYVINEDITLTIEDVFASFEEAITNFDINDGEYNDFRVEMFALKTLMGLPEFATFILPDGTLKPSAEYATMLKRMMQDRNTLD